MQTSDLIADEERMARNAWKHDLSKSALLVIGTTLCLWYLACLNDELDMQKGFASQEVVDITDNVLLLIKEYRAKGLPVFFTQHVSSLSSLLSMLTTRQGHCKSAHVRGFR